MTLFLGKDPSDESIEWKETYHLQTYVVQEAKRAGYLLSGSHDERSGGRGSKAKATGLVAGEPDLRFYLPSGKVVFIELKTKDGTLSKVQKAYHQLLKELGFEVYTVFGKSPEHTWTAVKALLEGVV